MGWSIGTGENDRDIGYGVPAMCDHPKCVAIIDRGLSYCCGGMHGGNGGKGCGLYFCEEHLVGFDDGQRCPKCARYDQKPYKPKPDIFEWIRHKLTDESWQKWREKYPEKTAELQAKLEKHDNALCL